VPDSKTVRTVTASLRRAKTGIRERVRTLSLRARLLTVTLMLVTVGLGIAGAVTFSSLRSFLLDRLDVQLQSAQKPALRLVQDRLGGGPGGRGGREPGLGELPQDVYIGLYDMQDALIVQPLGGQTPAPLQSGPGFYTGDLPGAGSYRFLSSRVVNPVGVEFRFLVGIPLKDVNSTLGRLVIIEVLVGLGVLVAIGAAGLWLVRLGLKPLSDIEGTAAAIAAGDLSRRIEQAPETTEVGRLGRSLNTMLGTIEASFAERKESERRLRQFVADASHELQTPLTSVRGYAELFRRGAAERPEDLANAMHRIEAESQRMSLLVDDLLILARLDQGRPMTRERVDLVPLVRDLVGDVRVVDSDRPIDFDSDDAAVITGDGERIKQVVANLLSNARTHTPGGTPIRVSVRMEGDTASVVVADRGQGMPAEHADRVFERFFRADPSRARTSGGSGLGLSIVAAIVAAHGGTVTVESAPGDGTTFTVRLPVLPPARRDDGADQSQQTPSAV
jgi:two-component system, OmpR family, sensor kinase